ncbi:hypothetical protein [Geofilum rubicundum]|uniref:Uncharacterized protein n=1 Tax=Geofilum rubicundum JCM 15548 TaxID=1236989 RepID=A0A0E9LUJ7_9BACT|nr:hypothetical protein [Geofilum rubicundum]GAO28530.1 hypothetical protein JCM15548_1636 [Geofilum rubicundum JCM 15548]
MIKTCQLHIEGEGTENAILQEAPCSVKYKRRFVLKNATGVITELNAVVEFDAPIVSWRNHDYTWVDASRQRMAHFHSPKALLLKNGHKVVAGETHGLWVFDPKHPKRLKWVMADSWLTPLFRYDEKDVMHFTQPDLILENPLTFTFLFTTGKIPEFSRSRIPFSAILNFSDHCDFDSLELMERQRALFKKCQVRISKGAFLFHFSKRAFNVSLERQGDELQRWEADGHELCYHSLSQSIRPENQWQKDFEAFENDGPRWPTWIDHAFQPYNLTKMASSGYKVADWAHRMHRAGVRYLWNYLDGGHSGRGVINQLDVGQFSLRTYIRTALKIKSLASLTGLLRTYILYFSDEQAKKSYSQLVNNLRRKLWKKGPGGMWGLARGLAFLGGRLFSLLVDSVKKEVLPAWQKYGTTFFSAHLGGSRFWFFQTVEVHDFISTFSAENLKLLTESSGICLAHTYFADDDPQKPGRVFLNKRGGWMPGIEDTFQRIGDAAEKGELWLASVAEIAEFFDSFQYLRFDVDERGNIHPIVEKGGQDLVVRYVE